MAARYSNGIPPPSTRVRTPNAMSKGIISNYKGAEHVVPNGPGPSARYDSDTNEGPSKYMRPGLDQKAKILSDLRKLQSDRNHQPFFCTCCKQGFTTKTDEEIHKKSKSHNSRYMRTLYNQMREEVNNSTKFINIALNPDVLKTDGKFVAQGCIELELKKDSRAAVRLTSMEFVMDIEGLTLQHPALVQGKALTIEPGHNILIPVVFQASCPIEILVPIGFRMNFVDEVNSFFHFSKIKVVCATQSTQVEDVVEEGNYEYDLHGRRFDSAEKIYGCPKIRTNNHPDLEMPVIKESFEIPEKLKKLQRYIASVRMDEVMVLEDSTHRCFDEIRNLLYQPIHPSNYIMKFDLMLFLEEISKQTQLETQSLAAIALFKVGSGEYRVELPGLPERRPAINEGDKLELRESVASNRAFKGRFTSIENCYAKFVVDTYFDRIYDFRKKYAIQFEFNRKVFRIMHNTVRGLETNIFSENDSSIFPTSKMQLCPPLFPNDLSAFFDSNVGSNPEQRKAVVNIVRGCHRPAPFILFGPPGTGKTSTLAEAIKQILYSQKNTRVLVCASSNSACDVICDKLLKHENPQILYRIYSASFNLNKMSPDIRAAKCHNYSKGTVEYPDEMALTKYRVVIATLATSHRFASLRNDFFTHVFIDECGFSMEPESLIPLFSCVRNWKKAYANQTGCHVILAGDIQQLGPVLANNMCHKFLSMSLMERLMKDPQGPYQRPYNEAYIVKLLRNYRSHASILKVPNKLFYEDELQVYADQRTINTFIDNPLLPNKQFPIIMHNCVSEEKRDPMSTSFYNQRESDSVMYYIERILRNRNIREKDIGVITPYAAQGRRLKSSLMRKELLEIKVGSVEEFQGQERLVIIISTVRNCSDLLQKDLLQRLGFLKHPKRFNVALTRAKALLICIGNASILRLDQSWREFIDFAQQNGAWSGVSPEESLYNMPHMNDALQNLRQG